MTALVAALVRRWAMRAVVTKILLVAAGVIGIVAVEPGEVWRWFLLPLAALYALVFWGLARFWLAVLGRVAGGSGEGAS
ncbi:MAG TPA: hypothetical protein VEA41_01010 [Salinarimonas sp.]|jgi:hypothetical protein|nr:hypothetical protein [Salinarimonas sp.]